MCLCFVRGVHQLKQRDFIFNRLLSQCVILDKVYIISLIGLIGYYKVIKTVLNIQ